MQYFKEYIEKDIIIDNNNYIEGIFNIIDDKNLVNGIDIDNNRALLNDIVYVIDNKVVNIKERKNDNIIGILYLDSKIKYGSIKDKPLYLFKPTNKKYPNFYVPYKNTNNKDSLHKIYVIIQFKKWDITDKLPIGTLIESIGKIGDKNSEYEHLRIFYNLRNNNWKVNNDKIKYDIEIINNLKNIKEDYTVFSIDPPNSKDIDDAFHFKKINETNYEIGIHIASPNIFFENNLFEIMNRVATIYLPDRKYNMLPNNYADNYISLLENEKRHVITLILTFDKNLKLINKEIRESVVKNIKNYSYEQFDNVFKYDTNLNEFMSFSKDFFKEENVSFDSHKLVENWMIFANKKIAQYLIDKNIQNLIIRKHNYNENNENEIICSNILLKKYLSYKNENSAFYELYNKDLIQYHSKLGNEYYTHFTSPIRRAVDFYIHYLIINNLNNSKRLEISKENINKIIDNINIFTKNSRKFDRNIKRLDFIFNIKNLDESIETYAYIIKISDYKLTIYIPEYNLEEKIIIIPRKLENIANINKEFKNGDISIIDKINFRIDEISKSYYLYQKIDIKLWIFTSFENFFDKIKIEVLE
jgi:exoribonuclease R